jgi:CRP/FNR family transcriptional regulator
LCLPAQLHGDDLARAERMVCSRRHLRTGETLIMAGARASAFFAVQSGCFKASAGGSAGERVVGFFLGGNLIGLEGLASGRHGATVVALEDSVACVLPYDSVERAERDLPPVQRRLHALLAHEIERDQHLAALVGSTRAEQRLAGFLIDLSERLVRRGYSASELRLRMRREDIASYVALNRETVSRLFSQLEQRGLIAVQRKHIVIRDMDGLRRLRSSVA